MKELAYDLYESSNVKDELEPIVLVHGLIETRKTWIRLAPKIAEITSRKIYAIDCRNHGESPRVKDYGAQILADDLNEFLCHHQISKIILLGHSMGGVVAMTFTLQHPEKVSKLIVEDCPAKKSENRMNNLVPTAVQVCKEILASIPPNADELSAKHTVMEFLQMFRSVLKMSKEALENYPWEALPFRLCQGKLVVDINLEVIADTILKDQLVINLSGVYNGETLFLYGGKSQFKVPQDEFIIKHFPRAEKVEFKSAGHFIHHEYVEDFIMIVSDFILQRNQPTKSKY